MSRNKSSAIIIRFLGDFHSNSISGEGGGKAVAEVLLGDYNPGGPLPLTYYRNLDELPPFDDYDITKGSIYKYFKGDVFLSFWLRFELYFI